MKRYHTIELLAVSVTIDLSANASDTSISSQVFKVDTFASRDDLDEAAAA